MPSLIVPLQLSSLASSTSCVQGSGGTVDPASLSSGNAAAASSAVDKGIQDTVQVPWADQGLRSELSPPLCAPPHKESHLLV